MIDKLSKGEISTSFLDEIVEETEAIRINSALPNKGPRLSLDENLNESQSELLRLLSNNDSDPVEVYRLQNEITQIKSEIQVAATNKVLQDNPNLLDEVVEQTSRNYESQLDPIISQNSDSISLPKSVVRKLRKEGKTELELIDLEIKKGDSMQAWFAGGEYNRVTILGEANTAGFVKVEYVENGVAKKTTMPIEHLAITEERIKAASNFHKISIDELLNETPNAEELVQQFIRESSESPRIRKLEQELSAIQKNEGVMGVISDRYVRLNSELRELRYPLEALSDQEIESVFKPLAIVYNKTKLGRGDEELIEKAEAILKQKKRFYPGDKKYRIMLEEIKKKK